MSQLVAEKVIPSQWSEEVQGTVPERVDWFRVAQELDRPPRACKNKHLALLKSASQARAGQEIMNKVMGMAAVKEEKEEKEEKVSDDGEKDGGGESGTESGSESDTEGEGEGESEGEEKVVRERDHREGGKVREKEATDGVSEGAGSDGEKTQEMNDSADSAVVDLTAVEAV